MILKYHQESYNQPGRSIMRVCYPADLFHSHRQNLTFHCRRQESTLAGSPFCPAQYPASQAAAAYQRPWRPPPQWASSAQARSSGRFRPAPPAPTAGASPTPPPSRCTSSACAPSPCSRCDPAPDAPCAPPLRASPQPLRLRRRPQPAARARAALMQVLTGHHKSLSAVAWSPHDPNLLAVASGDADIVVWDIAKRSHAAQRSVPANCIPSRLCWRARPPPRPLPSQGPALRSPRRTPSPPNPGAPPTRRCSS